MANWITLKQLSEKRGIAESDLRTWANLGYIASSRIENVLMIDDESLTQYLDVHQTQDLGENYLEKIIKEKELEEWLRGLEGMDRLVDDYVGDKIPLWEKIMNRQGMVCCAWEKTAFEGGLKVGIRLMMEAMK